MVISISDFPFICRVCLSRNDLKLFEEEKHLLDLYLRITGIGEEVINSSPDNVCCTCINTLMDILTFIDLAKCNDSILRQCRLLEIDSKIAIKGDLRDNEIKMTSCPPLKDSPTHDSSCVCCVCASSSNLVPFCDPHTLSTFKTITYVGPSSEKEIPNKICDKCVEKLMSISAFIKLSKSNMYLYQELTSQKVSENRYLDKTNVQFKAEIDFPDLKENNHEMDVIENKECLTNESEDWMKVEVKTENFDEENIRMDIIKFKNLHEYLEVKEEYIGDSAKKCSEITVEETEFKLEEGTLSKDEPEYATNEHLQSTGKTYFENEVKPLIVHKHQLVFKCEVCRRNFSTPQNKNNHLSSHFGKNPVTCTICGKWFVGKREYIEHYRVHISKEPKSNISYKIVCPTNIPVSVLEGISNEKERPYQCEVCSKSFIRKSHLKVHYERHTAKRPFACEMCSLTFSKKSDLKTHIRSHTGESHFKCELCSKAFSYVGCLERHMMRHNREKPKCKICGQSFIHENNLKWHLTTHTAEEKRCKICMKTLLSNYSLEKHMRIHTGERPFKCSICTKSFSQKCNLKAHMNTHNVEKPCKKCSEAFTSEADLQIHMRIHGGKEPFQCETCLKVFSRKKHLEDHLRKHTGETPFKCEICPKTFSQQRYLVGHMNKHFANQPQCKVCLRCFSGEDKFITHMKGHSDEKPRCHLCGKTYNQKSQLNVHLKKHQNDKPFECEVCQKGFFRKCDLKRHMGMHLEEKPFKCDICSRGFSQKDNLKAHMNVHVKKQH